MSKSQLSISNLSIKQYYWILAVVVVLVFGNTLFNGYNYDDNLVTMHHPLTSKGFKAIGKIFTSPYYTNGADIQFGYRPITHLSFAIEHQLFGEKPAVSHFFNLLIYLGCVLAFFKLISNWFGNQALFFAFGAALLFAVHPVHSEAVASIKNRDELLAFLFAMLAFVQLNRFAEKQQWWRLLLSVFLFGIALLSKKSVYPLVFLVPLVLLFIHKQVFQITIIISIIISLTAALVVSEFNLQLWFLLTILPILWSIVVCAFYNSNKLLPYTTTKWFGYIVLVVAVLFSGLAIAYTDFTFFVPAIVLFVYLAKKEINKELLVLSIIVSCAGVALMLHLTVVSHLSVLIALFACAPSIKNKKITLLNLTTLLVALFAVLFIKPNLGTVALVLVYAAVAFFEQHKKNLTIAVLVFVSVVELVFFGYKYQHLLLLLFSVYLVASVYKPSVLQYIKVQTFFLFLLIPILFLTNTKRTITDNTWKALVISEQQIKNAQQEIKSKQGGLTKVEGRSLSYVENTLIGNQTLEAKISTGVVTLAHYLRLSFYPYELNFYYGFAKVETSDFKDTYFILGLAFILFLGLLSVLGLYTNKLVFIGGVWFLFCVLLFSNWVELVAGMVGERLLFTASAGFTLFIVPVLGLVLNWLKINKGNTFGYLVVIVGVLFSVRAIARNADWKNHLTLMEHDMPQLEKSVYANHMYAQACMNEATNNAKIDNQARATLVEKAEKALLSATKTYPLYFNAQFDLARIYLLQQRYAEAKTQLENAYNLDTTNLFVLEELSKTCFDLNLAQETVYYGEKYLKQYPQNENMYEILVYTLFRTERLNEAKHWDSLGLTNYPANNNLIRLKSDIEVKLSTQPIAK